jgi:AAA domain
LRPRELFPDTETGAEANAMLTELLGRPVVPNGNGHHNGDQGGPEPAAFVYMDTVEAEEVEWLWPGYIPLGKLTMLEGDPGLGKSMLTLSLAGTVTGNAKRLPDGQRTDVDGGVVLVSLEDGLADTIRPRLDAIPDADLAAIIALNEVSDGDGGRRLISIPGDLGELERAIIACNARLVILDPLTAILGAKHDINKDQDVRRALAPLAALAERHGCAVVILRHLGKEGGKSALYRGAGSIGVIGAARAGLMVAKSPDDPEHERIFSQTKSNLGRPMPSLSYRIEAAPNGVGYVVWGGQSTYSADQLANQGPVVSGAQAEAVAFLQDLLKDGPVYATEAEAARKAAGISDRTLDRARKRLHVQAVREGGLGSAGQWKWAYEPILGILEA